MIISYTLMVFLMHAISEPRIISPIPATLTDTCSARLINDSAIPIIAVVTFWRIMQPNGGGQMMAIEINQDFYTDDPQIPAY